MLARYHRELLNYFTRAMRDREHAADVVQEAYARALSLQQLGQPIHEPRALLFRIARNLLIDQHRRRSVRGEGLPHAAEGSEGGDDFADAAATAAASLAAPQAYEPEAALASTQGVAALLATIEALPPRCREAFVLHKFDGLPHAEVAARMGISRKAVEQHLKLALAACRRCREG